MNNSLLLLILKKRFFMATINSKNQADCKDQQGKYYSNDDNDSYGEVCCFPSRNHIFVYTYPTRDLTDVSNPYTCTGLGQGTFKTVATYDNWLADAYITAPPGCCTEESTLTPDATQSATAESTLSFTSDPFELGAGADAQQAGVDADSFLTDDTDSFLTEDYAVAGDTLGSLEEF